MALISKAAYRLLTELRNAEAIDDLDAAEVVCEGRFCYVGSRRVAKATVNELLRLVLLRDVGDAGAVVQRYALNEEGRAILQDPNYVPQILRDERVAERVRPTTGLRSRFLAEWVSGYNGPADEPMNPDRFRLSSEAFKDRDEAERYAAEQAAAAGVSPDWFKVSEQAWDPAYYGLGDGGWETVRTWVEGVEVRT